MNKRVALLMLASFLLGGLISYLIFRPHGQHGEANSVPIVQWNGLAFVTQDQGAKIKVKLDPAPASGTEDVVLSANYPGDVASYSCPSSPGSFKAPNIVHATGSELVIVVTIAHQPTDGDQLVIKGHDAVDGEEGYTQAAQVVVAKKEH